MWREVIVLSLLLSLSYSEVIISSASQEEVAEDVTGLYTIEGKVYPPEMIGFSPEKWQIMTSVSLNGGDYLGFLKEDGTFVVSGVPSGSYVLEVTHPDYFYEPIRVEINPKGKFRARKVNFVQPSQVIQMPYPLRMKALTRIKYFQTREQWKITDFLFSPMVLMMVLPLVLMILLPKMVNDPETKKEIENIQFPKMTHELPEISEMIASLFSDPPKQAEKEKKPITSKQSKKRN